MLTAWDKARDATLALPDFEDGSGLEEVRTRTRRGDLVCPTCHQLLWVHAGEVRIPHFAHRSLSDCPQGRVSEAVLGARRLLYRFFQVRIESGKLRGEIVLAPSIAGLPGKVCVDLMLRRTDKPAVHVLLLESSLQPDVRTQIQARLGRRGGVFRPVFLHSRLRRSGDEPRLFRLGPAALTFIEVVAEAVFGREPPANRTVKPGGIRRNASLHSHLPQCRRSSPFPWCCHGCRV